jgi:hypothetical protein
MKVEGLAYEPAGFKYEPAGFKYEPDCLKNSESQARDANRNRQSNIRRAEAAA